MVSESDSQELSRKVNELHRDADVVRHYGETHPGVVVGLRIDRGPPVELVVLLWDDPAGHHAQELRGLVSKPERLQVEAAQWSAESLEEVRSEIHSMAMGSQGIFKGWGPGFGVVTARLRADQEALAAELHDRYGGMVSLTLGTFPYPMDRPLTWVERLGRPASLRSEEVTIPGLQARIELVAPTIRAGADSFARLVLANVGDSPIELRTDQPLRAHMSDPDTREAVGGFTGNIAGTGRMVCLAPGEQTEIQVWIGTASLRRDLGYALPPGGYTLLVHLPVYQQDQRGPHTAVTVPPVEIVVVE